DRGRTAKRPAGARCHAFDGDGEDTRRQLRADGEYFDGGGFPLSRFHQRDAKVARPPQAELKLGATVSASPSERHPTRAPRPASPGAATPAPRTGATKYARCHAQ